MFSFLKRKPPSAPLSFNDRVRAFWKWYEEVAPRFYQTIEDKRCSDLSPETNSKVDELFPGFAWVYGPGENGVGHSFTLSGEGNIHKQLLALHWLSLAPTINGWTFYAARQPGAIKGQVIETNGIRFDPAEIWVTPEINRERQVVDLHIWHPSWDTIEQNQRSMVTFLFLDESLGEYGTDQWIGELKFSKDKLAKSFPLEELAGFIAQIARENEWKKYPPGRSYTGLKVKVENRTFPRSDVIYQTTAVTPLIREYLSKDGEMEDPLKAWGADYLYITIDLEYLPKGREVTARGEIEEALEAALKAGHSARMIGGATGRKFSYIDILIFDGARSVEIIKQKLRALGLPPGTMIEYFAREKRGHRIAL